MDEQFLQRVMEIVERHIDDTEFGVEDFSKEMGMSRMHLHRKLRALTDQTAGSLIRTLRLRRAASLLKQDFENVSQIAYEVGFNNPSYFTECFKKEFGQAPSQYAARHSR